MLAFSGSDFEERALEPPGSESLDALLARAKPGAELTLTVVAKGTGRRWRSTGTSTRSWTSTSFAVVGKQMAQLSVWPSALPDG
ncbi:MAG: hypothetical protein ACE5GX_09225 [Thermoanaerobaculia bacterium]